MKTDAILAEAALLGECLDIFSEIALNDPRAIDIPRGLRNSSFSTSPGVGGHPVGGRDSFSGGVLATTVAGQTVYDLSRSA